MTITHLSKKLWNIPEIQGISSLAFLRYCTKALGLGRWLLITHWLSPADLGGYGLAIMILAVTEVVTETGVNLTLLKHPDRLKNYIHTAWAVSLLRGVIIAAVMVGAAGPLSRFFGVAAFPHFLWLCAIIALVKGTINPAIISFQQDLQFSRETLYRFPLQLLDLGTGLLLSWWWQSPLGLLAGLLISACAEAVSSFIVFPQRPDLRKAKISDLLALYRETRTIVMNGIVHYLSEHADDFLIGRLLGPAVLGLYQTGYKLVSAVTLDIASIVGVALFPILARRQKNGPFFRTTFLRGVAGFLLVLLPVGLVSFVFPRQLVAFLFGDEWQMVAVLLPWLFLAAAAKSLLNLANPVAVLTNTIRWHLMCNLLIVVIMLSCIAWFGPQYGAVGAAASVAFAMLLVQPILGFITWRSLRRL